MISSLSGRVVSVSLNHVIIEVGGVGMQVQVTPIIATNCKINSQQLFFTSLLVREDSLTLYGFLDGAARDFLNYFKPFLALGHG